MDIENADKKGLTIISFVDSSGEPRFIINIGQNHKSIMNRETIIFNKVNIRFFISFYTFNNIMVKIY